MKTDDGKGSTAWRLRDSQALAASSSTVRARQAGLRGRRGRYPAAGSGPSRSDSSTHSLDWTKLLMDGTAAAWSLPKRGRSRGCVEQLGHNKDDVVAC